MITKGWEKPEFRIPDVELLQLRDMLESLEEYHICLVLGMAERFSPSDFSIVSAQLLSHPSMSVRINAYRVTRAVAPEDISDDLRQAVSRGLEKCPERDRFADALKRESSNNNA